VSLSLGNGKIFLKERDGGATKKTLQNNSKTDFLKPDCQGLLMSGLVLKER